MKRGIEPAVLLIAAVLLLGSSLAYAGSSDTCYVTIRCTATLSIDIRDKDGNAAVGNAVLYEFGEVPLNATTISTTPVCIVRNDSLGAVERFKIYVSSVANGEFSGDDPDSGKFLYNKASTTTFFNEGNGIDEVVIWGLFRKNQPPDSKFGIEDTLVGELTYGDAAGDPLSAGDEDDDYDDFGYNNDDGKVLPYSYSTSKCDRKLWLKIHTPRAISKGADKAYIKIRATATWGQ